MSKDKVGFGDDYSRRAPTRTMNAFVTVETRPCAGGADVIVTPRRGHVIMPEVDVAERRFDSRGGLQVRDEDTGAWLAVER